MKHSSLHVNKGKVKIPGLKSQSFKIKAHCIIESKGHWHTGPPSDMDMPDFVKWTNYNKRMWEHLMLNTNPTKVGCKYYWYDPFVFVF
jgi:hypothetical protein